MCIRDSVSIALAHHANDNAETVLFQMARGSGVHGMCGMHPKRVLGDDILIVRPLLCVSRGQIEEYLKKCGQEYRTDGTNLDINYSRNRIRHHIPVSYTHLDVYKRQGLMRH